MMMTPSCLCPQPINRNLYHEWVEEGEGEGEHIPFPFISVRKSLTMWLEEERCEGLSLRLEPDLALGEGLDGVTRTRTRG